MWQKGVSHHFKVAVSEEKWSESCHQGCHPGCRPGFGELGCLCIRKNTSCHGTGGVTTLPLPPSSVAAEKLSLPYVFFFFVLPLFSLPPPPWSQTPTPRNQFVERGLSFFWSHVLWCSSVQFEFVLPVPGVWVCVCVSVFVAKNNSVVCV